MKLNINGEPTEANLYSLDYGEHRDIMNGILFDMPENYIFLSDQVESHRDAMEDMIDEPCEVANMATADIDWSVAPHSWVLKSVQRMIVHTAEEACREEVDG